MATMNQKIIRTGVLHRCTAPMYLTTYNRQQNKEVHKACFQKPKFKPVATCTGCKYLEVKNGNI